MCKKFNSENLGVDLTANANYCWDGIDSAFQRSLAVLRLYLLWQSCNYKLYGCSMPKLVLMIRNLLLTSGVARLGHTGAHALATRGCTTPVQVCIGADSIIVVDHKSGAKRSSNRTAQNYKFRTCEFAVLK